MVVLVWLTPLPKDRKMQVGVSHKKGCIGPYHEAQGKVGGQGVLSS
jgi:hypothetical protein